MKWLDYSLSLCKPLQSYLSYKHNTVLDSTIRGHLEPGMLRASGEVFTSQSPWQDRAGIVEMTVPWLRRRGGRTWQAGGHSVRP